MIKKTCLQCRRRGFIPWVRKIPWRREWLCTPVFLPGESHGQRNLVGSWCIGSQVRHDRSNSASTQAGMHVLRPRLAITELTPSACWGGFSLYETAHRIRIQTYLCPWGGTNGAYLCFLLNCYYEVSFDSFPLFLHVPTSLIKPILWLNFPTDKRLKIWRAARTTGPYLLHHLSPNHILFGSLRNLL